MAKEWDKIETAYSKLKKTLKDYQKAETDKRIKQVKSALDDAWKAEDAFTEALKAAMKGGTKGKKAQDFMSDDGFKKAMNAMEKEMAAHVKEVKSLTDYAKAAKPMHTQLRDLTRDIKKHILKGDKKQADFQKDAQENKVALDHAATATGKLNAAETLFGAQFTRVVQNNIDKANKKNKPAGPGDPAKLIEQKTRDDNEKLAKKWRQKIVGHCDSAIKQASNSPTSAAQVLKKADVLLKKLTELNNSYQTITKKNKDLITKNKDKTKINQVIKKLGDHMKAAQNRYDEAEEALKT